MVFGLSWSTPSPAGEVTSAILKSCAWTCGATGDSIAANPSEQGTGLQAPHHDVFHQNRRLPQM